MHEHSHSSFFPRKPRSHRKTFVFGPDFRGIEMAKVVGPEPIALLSREGGGKSCDLT